MEEYRKEDKEAEIANAMGKDNEAGEQWKEEGKEGKWENGSPVKAGNGRQRREWEITAQKL